LYRIHRLARKIDQEFVAPVFQSLSLNRLRHSDCQSKDGRDKKNRNYKETKMKTQIGIATTIVGAALLITVFAPGSFAQSQGLQVQIPFDFYVGTTLLPAGAYQINSLQNAIRIYDGRKHVAVSLTNPQSNALSTNRLVFNRYGTANFLSALYWEGYNAGQALTPTSRELDIASKGATRTRLALVPAK
jgi:hypothetical protein